MPPALATTETRAPDDPAAADLHPERAAPSRRATAAWTGAVPRLRLIDRLLEAPNTPLVVLTAPAGFGKTTVLSQWEEHDARPFTWVRPDPGEDDPGRVLATACGAFARRRGGHVLVVDDADLLREGTSAQTLGAIVERLPEGSQVAIASRTEPPLPLGRLRAHRRVLELRTTDLAMTRCESAALLAGAGLDLAPSQVDALVVRTEGWAAGLYLAALAIQAQADSDTALVAWTGEDRLVADYVRDELLAPAPRSELEFLVRTSVLDRLSGPLCDAILDRADSAGRLRQLSRSNLLVQPLDRRDECYRYHPLLAETLRAELRRLEPAKERELNRRASRWHEEHGDTARAIEHAIVASDPKRAGDLLWRNAARYLGRGQNTRIQRWLGSFSEQQIAREPQLALVAATSSLTTGDGNMLRHWTAATARLLQDEPRHERSPQYEAGVHLMRSALGEGGIAAMGANASRGYALAPAGSPLQALARLLEGVTHQLAGRTERARDALEEGASRGATTAPAIQAQCLAQLALVSLDEDDVGLADSSAGRALAAVELLGLRECPTAAIAFAVSAVVRAARGRVDDASRDLRHTQRLLSRLIEYSPWYEAQVRLVSARAALRLSHVPTARTLLAESARFVRRIPDSPLLERWLAEAHAQADGALPPAATAAWVLTTAELRVLQFLPSHLSFPDIAGRLCVSPNTIKTHARAIYRKLDATSRAEAVLRARAKGLLDTPASI
jgi:LuxR family maltose regulon positive regulatory protein